MQAYDCTDFYLDMNRQRTHLGHFQGHHGQYNSSGMQQSTFDNETVIYDKSSKWTHWERSSTSI